MLPSTARPSPTGGPLEVPASSASSTIQLQASSRVPQEGWTSASAAGTHKLMAPTPTRSRGHSPGPFLPCRQRSRPPRLLCQPGSLQREGTGEAGRRGWGCQSLSQLEAGQPAGSASHWASPQAGLDQGARGTRQGRGAEGTCSGAEPTHSLPGPGRGCGCQPASGPSCFAGAGLPHG